MTTAVTSAGSRGHPAHSLPTNFGGLNSAIARGDLAAARTVFSAAAESGSPAAAAAKSRGSIEAIGSAIVSGDIEVVRKSLADFRSGRMGETESPPTSIAEPGPASSASRSSARSVQTGRAQTFSVVDLDTSGFYRSQDQSYP